MMREGCAILQKPARNAGRLPGFWWAWLVPALMAGTTLGCLADEAPTAGSGSQVSEAENGSTPAPTAIRTETRIPTQSGATLVVTPAAPATTMPVESPLAPVPDVSPFPTNVAGSSRTEFPPTPAGTANPPASPTPTVAPLPTAFPSPPVPLPGESAREPVEISIVDFAHQNLAVPARTTVVWTNFGTSAHTVNEGLPFGGFGRWASPLLPPGATFAFRFDQPGVFSYYCRIHPSLMRATILVTE